MLSKKLEFTLVICLLVFLTIATNGNAVDTTSQLVVHVDDILLANPLKPSEKVQMINIAQDDTVSLFVVRLVEGYVVKKHFHKTHDETIYVKKGVGQILVDDKWVDLKPGSLHFNPMGKIHSLRNMGSESLVLITVFTPAMKETDRNFVE
jgi:mannose-6-phosphate isomerase-like protein (cupin superfamily)